MGRTVALIVAAGSGSRAGGEVPKQYRKVAGKTLLAHAIDHLAHPAIHAIQVVIGAGQEAAYADAIGDRPLPAPVTRPVLSVVGGSVNRTLTIRLVDETTPERRGKPFGVDGAEVYSYVPAASEAPPIPVVDPASS